MDDFTGLEECESFYCYDDLWDYLVDWASTGTDFSSDYNFISDPLVEHVNKECPAIESDQELNGTDNAVVDCKVADVVTHSKDEKPVDCKGEKKPLEKPLTESFVGVLNKDTEADYGEFYRLCKEIGIETVSDLKRFNDEEAWRDGHLLDKLRAYRDELGADFQIKESVNPYKFTKEEQEEFNMDEDGVSLDSYDEYVRCNWCNQIFTKDSCVFEADLGWLCDRCYEAIISRGESLTIIKYPTDEDIAKTLTEEVKMTAKELKDKFGTDDVELINAGREPEERVELEEAKITMSKAEMAKLDKEVEEATAEVAKYKIPMKVQVTSADTTENVPDFEAVPEDQREAAKKAYDRYAKALAARPDRAKNEITYFEEAVEEDEEVLSSDPAENPSEDVKMANTASVSGMDFEAACKMFGVELEN
jgi:hypothetical protein